MRTAACAAMALAMAALAGCEQGEPARNVQHIKVENPHSDQLKALSPSMQRLGLMRAIRDSGKRCTRVTATGYQQEYRGMEMWVALCDDGRHWSIFIAPNADIQVRNCEEHRQLDLPQCRPITAPPPDPNADANALGF